MKSMELTAAEAKEMYSCEPMKPGDGPKYPYGLCLHLDTKTLAKLGISTLPEVGAKMALNALVTVVSVGMSQQQDGDKESRAELQITDMELASAKSDAERAKVLYPDMA